MKKIFALALAVACVVPANAAMLWDQYDWNTGNVVDQEFGDFPTFSAYVVGDASFGTAVTINSVGILLSNDFLAAVTTARLNIFSKVGGSPLPGDDPTAGTLVAASTSVFDAGAGVFELKASGLSINLAAGDYWIGLTAVTDFATHGQAFHLFTNSLIMDDSQIRNPGGGFGFTSGTSWSGISGVASGFPDTDTTLRIEGEAVPEPATMIALGAGALALIRRRRK